MDSDDLFIFIEKHRLGVLASVSPLGNPEASLVGIAVTEKLELIFDTIDTSRKCQNLRRHPKTAFVIGWEGYITLQFEGIADEPLGEELSRLKKVYFKAFPDGPQREKWPGITYFRVRPVWMRYSDFNDPQKIIEFSKEELNR
jgi:Pyridoxamine 5'-phosphate oxidase